MTQLLKSNRQVKPTFVLYLFLFLFAPPFLPQINTFLLVSAYSFFAILIKHREHVRSIFKTSGMKSFTVGFGLFFAYFIVVALINIVLGNRVSFSEYVLTAYRFALILPFALICVLYIIIKCKEYHYSIDDLVFSFILCGMIEVMIALVSFCIPACHDLLVQLMYRFTQNDVLLEVASRRLYGYANDMFDSFGYGVGMLAVLPFFLSFRTQKIKYLFFTPFFLFLTFINARTGIFIFAIGILCTAPLFFKMDKKAKIKFSITFLAIFLLLLIALGFIYLLNPDALRSSFIDILSIFKFIFLGERRDHGYDTASVLFDPSGWYLPQNILSLILGTGHTVFNLKGFPNSDVGYINDLWLVGIAGVILLYGTFLGLFYHVWKAKRDVFNKSLAMMMLLCFLLFQIKGRAIMANTGILLTLSIAMGCIYLECHNKFNQDCTQAKTSITEKLIHSDALVSVIIPVYRTEQYLGRCIDSVMSQTYSNLEVILVDDGSPDACPQICDSYTNKDPRVKVIHKENGGLSDARNAGIESASGDYIAFVDSDDYIAPQMIQTLLQYVIDKKADISVCNYYKVFENGEKLYHPKTVQEKVMTNLEAMEDIFTASNLCEVITWNKLYAARLFKDTEIRFPVGKIHEDNFTTYKLFYEAQKVVYIDIPLYYYRQRNDSIMGRDFYERRLQVLEATAQTKAFVSEHHLPLQRQAENYEMLIYFNLLNELLNKQVKSESVKNQLRTFLEQHQKALFRNPYVTFKHKVGLLLIRTSIYERLINLYLKIRG